MPPREPRGTPLPEGPNNPWENADIPEPGILTATEAHQRINEVLTAFKSTGIRGTDKDVLASVAKTIGCAPEELKLGGLAEVSKGDKPIIVFGDEHIVVSPYFYGVSAGMFEAKELFAIIKNPSTQQIVEAIVKPNRLIRGTTEDHLIISQKLAKELEVDSKNPGQIVVESIYQKAGDLNLDEI